MMVTYEHIKTSAEILAFIAISGVVYLTRTLSKEFGAHPVTGKAVRILHWGFFVIWAGYLVNVLNDIFPYHFMKVLDDVLIAIGLSIVLIGGIGIKQQIGVDIRPAKVLNGEPKIPLGAYLVKANSGSAVQSILRLVSGRKVLALTRTPPLWERFNVPYIWVSSTETEGSISPMRLSTILHALTKELSPRTFLIVDGIEYLVLHNGETPTLRFLLALKDLVLNAGAGLVVIADPGALDKKFFGMLEREFDILSP